VTGEGRDADHAARRDRAPDRARSVHDPADGAAPLAGLLLTGGSSRRMGHDKGRIVVAGEPIAQRIARLVAAVAAPVLEVGPGLTGLDAVREEPPGGGPLAAIVAGAQALGRLGHRGPALVVACDLPLLTADALAVVADRPGGHSVLPVLDGRAQPLCARWSAHDLRAASVHLARGERSLVGLPDRRHAELLDELDWPAGVGADELRDADTPADLDALGVAWRPGDPRGGGTGR